MKRRHDDVDVVVAGAQEAAVGVEASVGGQPFWGRKRIKIKIKIKKKEENQAKVGAVKEIMKVISN